MSEPVTTSSASETQCLNKQDLTKEATPTTYQVNAEEGIDTKQSIRLTCSDPLASSHLSRGDSNSSAHTIPSPGIINKRSLTGRRSSSSSNRSRERRARWIRDRLQNYCGDVDRVKRQHGKMEGRDSGFEGSRSRSVPKHRFQFDWDSTTENSVNWMSGNDSKSSQFHRPYSAREQDRFWEEAAAGRSERKLRAGSSLPLQHSRISYLEEEEEVLKESGSGRKYLESEGADPEEEREEEEEEYNTVGELEGNKSSFHLTRQRNLPYPYRLKNHYQSGEEGRGGLRGGGGGRKGKEERDRSGSQSPCSITSESESQETCENALDPPRLGLLSGDPSSNGTGHGNGNPNGRKFSVLFSLNDAWNEENIVQSFKELSPTATQVFEAAWTGNRAQLEEILKEPENCRKLEQGLFKDIQGRQPLHLSSACGHVSCVQLLLAKGGQVNASDGNENWATPLSCAASCGSVPVVKLLLEKGANVNAGYEQGKTALHGAVQAGSVECAKILLEAGAKQNPPQVYSETPLHIAAALGDAECVQLLLDYGADVNLCKGSNRSTALHLAAEEGSAACLRLLLKAGASHGAKDIRGHTALHVAATCDADSVIALLQAGADPNCLDSNGRSALHCAVARGSRAAECVRLLVESGADIDCQDNYGYSPLHLAAVNESSQCASILLHHGSDVTLKTNAGTNALSLLVRRIPDVMRYLVDRLDAAVTIHDHDPADPDCEIRLDFRAIVPNCEKRDRANENKKVGQNGYLNQAARMSLDGGGKGKEMFHKPHKETEFLTCLVAAGNKKILAHPLSEAFLTLKWERVRKFFWASLLFQIVLVALFTLFVIEVYLRKCPFRRREDQYVDPSYGEEEDDLGRSDINLHIPSPQTPRPPTSPLLSPPLPPDPYKLLWNTSTLSLILPPFKNGSERKHNISKRSSGGFEWFRVRPPRKKNPTPKAKKDAKETLTSNRMYLPTVPPLVSVTRRSKSRSRVNIILGGAAPPSPPLYSPTPAPPEEDGSPKIEPIPCELTTYHQVIWMLLVGFTSLMTIKEVFQLIQSPVSYVFSSENWGQWLLISSVTIAAWSTSDTLQYWQYPAAACGIFLAWGLMLLQVGRFPALGLYVQMLGKVAANFGLFILAYACLLVAFALAFCVLFPEHPPYSSVFVSILKVFTMMVGEVDYEDLFYNDEHWNDDFLFPLTAHLLYGAFVVFVTIVLMNLLVGLAVHDIQGLQKGAKLNRLSRQTALISRLESFIFSKKLGMLLPRSLGSILQRSALLVPSAYNWSFYFRPNDPRDKRLPKEIKQASLRLAAVRHASGKSKSHSHRYPQHPPETHPGPISPRILGTPNPYKSRKISSNASHHLAPDSFQRVEQRLDHLQSQLDKILVCLNGRVDAVFDAIINSDDKSSVRRLSSMMEQSDNDNVFLEGLLPPNSVSSSPSGGAAMQRPTFSKNTSIFKDISCEKDYI